MKVYLITFALPKEDVRTAVFEEIKKCKSWAKLTETSYALISDRTAHDLFDNSFLPLLAGGDQLYITELGADWRGRGAKEVIQWLQDSARLRA